MEENETILVTFVVELVMLFVLHHFFRGVINALEYVPSRVMVIMLIVLSSFCLVLPSLLSTTAIALLGGSR